MVRCDVPIDFASGKECNRTTNIKGRIMRYIRDLVRINSEKEDDVTEVVFHYDRKEEDVFKITFVDSGLGEERFVSNTEFEGPLLELHAKVEKLEKRNEFLESSKKSLRRRLETAELKLAGKKRRPGRPKSVKDKGKATVV